MKGNVKSVIASALAVIYRQKQTECEIKNK